jgi:phenylacetic acid degradation operon negative regulatory protein
MADVALRNAIDKLTTSLQLVPRQLIATIYGDMLVPRRGAVWLSSLVQMAEPFGIAEYLSRTTALRMVKVGWLRKTRVGKLSFYDMSEKFVRGTVEYYQRVYTPPTRDWSGSWRLLLTGAAQLDLKVYTALRRNLLWRGVGQVAPHVFISAAASLQSIEEMLAETGILERVQVMDASLVSPSSPNLMRAIVADAWDITSIEQGYETFLARFRPIWSQLEKAKDLDPKHAYLIRALLMNEHRRLALRDPRLPREFLPTVWAGEMAFVLTRNIYQAVLEPSEAYLKGVIRTPDGPFGDAPTELYTRFGGLDVQRWPKPGAQEPHRRLPAVSVPDRRRPSNSRSVGRGRG